MKHFSRAHFENVSQDQQEEGMDASDFFKDALDRAAIVAVTDRRGTILSVNSKFCEISGYGEAELIGTNHRILKSGLHSRVFFANLYRKISGGEVWHGEICNRRKDGSYYWVDTTIIPHRGPEGMIERYIAIRFDITPQKNAEQKLWQLANLDALTGLPNRLKFMNDLSERISAQSIARGVVVGLIDLDNFKDINDSLGHATGDELLKEISSRLQWALEPADVIARLGGDEFALILNDCEDDADITVRVLRIMDVLKDRIMLCGMERRVGGSIGIARFPENGSSANELLRNADIALYVAKQKGRSRIEYFNEKMKQRVQHRTELLLRVEEGLIAGEFLIRFQPIVPLDPRLPVSFEALLRWRHPEHGQILPAEFASALTEENLAAAVGSFVLGSAIEQIRTWRADKLPFGSIAINTTLGDFRSPAFVNRILEAIARNHISTDDLIIEITEGMLLGRGGKCAREEIARLHAAGLRIAFDDFGTGFASLRHLRDLPIEMVKIDKSFVSSLETDDGDQAVVASVIDLAHRLGKRVTAEGVETAEQAAILKRLGCDNIQGFLIAPALSAGEARAFLAHPTARCA